jgi:hypothetical protein
MALGVADTMSRRDDVLRFFGWEEAVSQKKNASMNRGV